MGEKGKERYYKLVAQDYSIRVFLPIWRDLTEGDGTRAYFLVLEERSGVWRS